jgi:hypothetical protein
MRTCGIRRAAIGASRAAIAVTVGVYRALARIGAGGTCTTHSNQQQCQPLAVPVYRGRQGLQLRSVATKPKMCLSMQRQPAAAAPTAAAQMLLRSSPITPFVLPDVVPSPAHFVHTPSFKKKSCLHTHFP